jgi:hypothetical protein
LTNIQDHIFGPNVWFGANSIHGVPFASTVPLSTVFPHHVNDTPGKTNTKKMIMAEIATPESKAAERT